MDRVKLYCYLFSLGATLVGCKFISSYCFAVVGSSGSLEVVRDSQQFYLTIYTYRSDVCKFSGSLFLSPPNFCVHVFFGDVINSKCALFFITSYMFMNLAELNCSLLYDLMNKGTHWLGFIGTGKQHILSMLMSYASSDCTTLTVVCQSSQEVDMSL